MKCSNCQFDNPEGMQFIGKCENNLKGPIKPPDYSEPQSYIPKFLVDKILTSRTSIEDERKLVADKV